MKRFLTFWIERYFYSPSLFQQLLAYLLLPLTLIYCFIAYLRFLFSKPYDMGIKVVSVGNLIVGGSGKTPVVLAIATAFQDKKVAIVLRGYGRKSQGLLVVKDGEDILTDVLQSGDEAMLYAKSLQKATVIVSEDRIQGVRKAKEMGCDFVILDDAYRYFKIKKLDIVIDVKTTNNFCLPSGPYRQKLFKKEDCIMIEESKDFKRTVEVQNSTSKMVLLTAIARPKRLEPYLPKVIAKYTFEDHHEFHYDEVMQIYQKEQPSSFLITSKDLVKLEKFNFPYSLLALKIELSSSLLSKIATYID